jgi:hypothetical protein
MSDAIAASHRGLDAIRTMLPQRFDWLAFGVALALMSAPVFQNGRQLLTRLNKTEVAGATEEFSCARNPKN